MRKSWNDSDKRMLERVLTRSSVRDFVDCMKVDDDAPVSARCLAALVDLLFMLKLYRERLSPPPYSERLDFRPTG